MSADVLSHDISPLDEQYPTTLMSLTFESHGQRLLGRVYVAQGAGPHPTVLLLHGFPGDEQNGDLAHVFRRAGWNVMLFHYRGAWGSQGSFSFTHAFEDVPIALVWLRSPEALERYRVDASKIVLMGHSMGGFAALLTAAADPTICGVASISGFQFGWFAELLRQDAELTSALIQDWNTSLAALQGASAEHLVQEILDRPERWTLKRDMESLAQRSVFLLGGLRDSVAPPDFHHTPLVAALEEHLAPRMRSVLLPTDHTFSDSRVALARRLLAWLADL